MSNRSCENSTYLIFGSFCFSMFFFVWFLVPETKGLSLEAMDELFGVTDHKAPSFEDGSSRADEKPHPVAEQSEIQREKVEV